MGGAICFVGLGPGDPALLTQRGAARVAAAGRVVGDDTSTDELIVLARAGQRIVRIVTGDVLESPRAVAQARAVAAAGVPFEIVPGVGAQGTSSAFAGVVGRAVRVDANDVQGVLEGQPDDASVTLIARAGSPSQRMVTVRVREATQRAKELGDGAILVAFGVPEDALRWSERRPLFGKRVLVTRAAEQARETVAQLRDAGADPRVVPTIEIRPPSDPAPLSRALTALREGAYAWVAFTSANGVARSWDALVALGGDARAFGSSRLAAIGPATARALEQHGLKADVVAKEFRGELLAEAMLAAMRSEAARGSDAGSGPRVLLARAARARDVLPDTLREAGCVVDVVPAYETHVPPPHVADGLAQELSEGRIDAVLFTSSSTVDSLCDLLGPEAAKWLRCTRVASIGPVTTATAEARGVRVDVTAKVFTVAGLIDALAEN